VPDTSSADLCTTDHFVYSGGDAGSSVELYRVNGGAHTWPGSHPDFVNLLGMGITNWDFSAVQEIWRFFSQYRLNELVGVESAVEQIEFSVYPNPSQGLFQLRFESSADRLIEVRNTLGELVYSKQISSQTYELEIATSGIYVITVEKDGVRTSNKLVVE
jgi:polyhydroxybutyrate depolymerase